MRQHWRGGRISYREFRANLAAIVLLATGLVLATTCVVAVVAHGATARTAVPLSWPACFVLGAMTMAIPIMPPKQSAISACDVRLYAPSTSW